MPGWLEADGPDVSVGALCEVSLPAGQGLAEVVRVDESGIALVPLSDCGHARLGARVCAVNDRAGYPVGDAFLGRMVDAFGAPLDGLTDRIVADRVLDRVEPPAVRDRVTPTRPVWTGVRAIDAFVPIGIGQRIGVFAASGVGKTSLVAQIARQMPCDSLVLCLIGERGREVDALWSGLGGDTQARTVLVAATSDQPSAVRGRAVFQALALATDWRAQGRHVLLVIDSVTRLAMALREAGLAAGEPPTLRAYTPSVFSILPKIVEQCGADRLGGAITAVMTVLSETDDVDDPVSEIMKSLLDGHILLSREVAERGLFPAIDPLLSVSRCAPDLWTREQGAAARAGIAALAKYESVRLLVESGLYAKGSDAETDRALAIEPALRAFRQQGLGEHSAHDQTFARLRAAMEQRA
ncbi:MAG: FliI/YscN family ATPase [Proteobacteria bacterium]|nr:FliI/YscN family ATPase [Pseudomonadota bacterium]